MRTLGPLVAVLVLAARSGTAQTIPPIRSLPAATAKGPPMKHVNEVRQLSGGRVLVKDLGAHQIVLLDRTLANPRVVIDSAGPGPLLYGPGGDLIPYLADTTLFLYPSAHVAVVISPAGTLVRVIPWPSAAGLSPSYLKAQPDSRGRILYEARAAVRSIPGVSTYVTTIDIRMLLGHALGTSTIDTVRYLVRDTVQHMAARPGEVPPIFVVQNDWVVTSDGTLAMVRGQDYHIDWVDADGTVVPSPRIAHEWKRLSDDDKRHMADSMTVARDSGNAAEVAKHSGPGQPIYDAAGTITGWGIMPASAIPRPSVPPQARVPVPPKGIPDSLPPFSGSVLADADNHVWIPLPTTMVGSATIYDVVDRAGTLIDRVRTLAARMIGRAPAAELIGFGAGGNLYFWVREGAIGHLERVPVR